MTTRRPVTLGQGYRPLGGGDFRARAAFLNAVERLVPKALADLKRLPDGDEAQLDQWCRRWGFVSSSPHDDWLRQAAQSTRHYYLPLKDAAGVPVPNRFWWTYSYWAGPPITITWDPLTEFVGAFRRRVEQLIRDVGSRPDLEPTKVKRNPLQHFEWIALYQVGGLSYDAIAARYEPDEHAAHDARFVSPQAVRLAVHRVATLLDIALRRGHRGRPKKGTQER